MRLARPRPLPTIATLVVALVVVGSGVGSAASSSTTVVTAQVPTATNVNATGCASGVAGRTDFGVVLPGTSAVTTLDCVVTFDSSNGTASLQVAQADRSGSAMFRPSDGAVDTGFSGDGARTTSYGAGNDQAMAVAIDATGRILVAGSRHDGVSGTDLALTAYADDGSIDTTFSGDGHADVPVIGLAFERIEDLMVLPDGDILGVGYLTGFDGVIVRWNADGSLDTSFSGDGWATLDIAGRDQVLRSVVVLPDGTYVAAGYHNDATTGNDLLLAAWTPSGTPAPVFAGATYWTQATAGVQEFAAIALDPSGRIVGVGRKPGTGVDALLARFTTNLALDPTFGTSGIAGFHLGAANGDYVADFAIQSDGKILLHGQLNQTTFGDVFVARVLADGSALDLPFGGGGTGIANYSTGTWQDAGGIALRPDGRIVMAYRTATPQSFRFRRLLTTGVDDPTFGGGSPVTVVPGTGNATPYDVTLDRDGSIVAVGSSQEATLDHAIVVLGSVSVDDWSNGVADFNDGTNGAFGACLSTATLGATADWTANAGCPAVDGTHWRGIGTAPSTIAHTTVAGTTGARAELRFAFRAANSQAQGTYTAPLTFTVVAP